MIFNEQEYPNFLNFNNITLQELETFLQSYTFINIPLRNNIIEWKMRLPIFLYPFYDYIYFYKKIPTQQEFYEYYFAKNKTYFKKNPLTLELHQGLQARVYRLYPSLIRDIHFSLFLNTKQPFQNVIYNRKLDMALGIDVMLRYKDEFYGINLYTKTKIAVNVRTAKKKRHKEFDNVKYIELPLDLNKCSKIGNFFVYGEREFNELLSLIR